MQERIRTLDNDTLTQFCFEYLSVNKQLVNELIWRKKNGLLTEKVGIKLVDEAK